MNKKQILIIGWSFFGVFFSLGNIALFGYLLTTDSKFMIFGYMTLIYGFLINIFLQSIFILLSFWDKKNQKAWRIAALILLINLPIAAIYAYIGLNINL